MPLKRAFRELIDIAVSYGLVAHVSLTARGGHIDVRTRRSQPIYPM